MDMCRQPRRRSIRRGNALLEAALVLPILLSLTFGTIEYGYFFFVKHSLQGAAREGCRAAIVPTADNTSVTQSIASALKAAGLNSSNTTLDSKFTLTLTPSNISALAAGTAVTVQIDATWGQVGVRPLGLIGSSKLVRGTTVMRKEG
jgi:Flp pilus assembly protein TadG